MRIKEKDLADPTAWRYWQGGGETIFISPLPTPTNGQVGPCLPSSASVPPTTPCTHISRPKVASEAAFRNDGVRLPGGRKFRLVVCGKAVGPLVCHAAHRRVDVNPPKDVGHHGLYPSLLDPSSPSLNYDTIMGDTAFVYWTLGRNKTAVGAVDMARDLWRQKVRSCLDDAVQ